MNEPRLPAGVESLIRAVTRGSNHEDRNQRASTFARGLAMGALVGAAITGSTIWQRRQATVTTEPPRLGDGSSRPPEGPADPDDADDAGDHDGPAGGSTDR
jgi:hypothetical protein